jgi:hypothetical protein
VSRGATGAMLLLVMAIAGCSSTQEQSAVLERRAKRQAPAEQGLAISRQSTDVKVLATTVVHSSEAAAAVVTLRNESSHALRSVPIAITVTDAAGRKLFENDAGGLEAALVSVASLPAHATITWVDDQLPTNGRPASVSARVGASATVGAAPSLSISGVRVSEDPANGVIASGTVTNRSAVSQRELVLFGVARRGGRVVAAGRGVLAQLASGASAPFQVSLVGDARGARVEIAAPATTFR